MPCKLCETDPIHKGGHEDHKCGFIDGVFTPDNWCCSTLHALRLRVWQGQIGCRHRDPHTEEEAAIIGADCLGEPFTWLFIGWYKSRGRLTQCILADENGGVHVPTQVQVEQILNHYVEKWSAHIQESNERVLGGAPPSNIRERKKVARNALRGDATPDFKRF